MPGAVFQSGERVSLHTVEDEDLDAFARAHSDPNLRRPLGIDAPSNRDAIEEFFEETISSDEGVWFVVVVDEVADEVVDEVADEVVDEEPLGAVMFPEIDEGDGIGDLSYWILPEHQGEGYGHDAVALLLEYGFDERRLHRVRADCYASNNGSRSMLESLGFSQEGRFREAAFLDGSHQDVLRYGLLADEWRAE